jgi:DNA repair protein RecO (recombination protein O)
MKSFSSEAIILRRTNYGEADRILNVLTPDRGVMGAIAKGVRKPKSKLAGGLELFAVCDITLIQGRSDLATVSSARINRFYGKILHDYDRMQFAYEAIRKISKAANTVAEPEFYDLLKHTFACLEELAIDWRLTEIWFRLRLSQLLGQGLSLRYDHAGQPLAADQKYNFDIGEMGFVQSPNGRFVADDIKFLRLASVKDPEVLHQVGGLEGVLENGLWLARVVSE